MLVMYDKHTYWYYIITSTFIENIWVSHLKTALIFDKPPRFPCTPFQPVIFCLVQSSQTNSTRYITTPSIKYSKIHISKFQRRCLKTVRRVSSNIIIGGYKYWVNWAATFCVNDIQQINHTLPCFYVHVF
jgi:hypothetical protein